MSVQKTVTSEPSCSSTKGIPRLPYEVVALIRFCFWKEYFCLPIMLTLMPLFIPGFLALKSTGGFDMRERVGGR